MTKKTDLKKILFIAILFLIAFNGPRSHVEHLENIEKRGDNQPNLTTFQPDRVKKWFFASNETVNLN